MTTAYTQARALYLAFIMTLAVLATMMTQVVMQLIAQGLSDSGSVRVAPAVACDVSADKAHFTGCSSIL